MTIKNDLQKCQETTGSYKRIAVLKRLGKHLLELLELKLANFLQSEEVHPLDSYDINWQKNHKQKTMNKW